MTKEEENRILCPWTASLVDQFREIFGPGVTVKKTTEKRAFSITREWIAHKYI